MRLGLRLGVRLRGEPQNVKCQTGRRVDIPRGICHVPGVQKLFSLGAALAAALLCGSARAADWPNWRGPNHNGVSTETGWISQWPADGPKPLWKASVGTGFSSITVANGRAYTVGNRQESDTVWCFDAATGSNLWQYTYPSPLAANLYEGGPSASPTLDEGRVYIFSKSGLLYCLDAEKGGVIWETNAAAALGAEAPKWGFASSVLVQGNLLILDIGSNGAALDKNTRRVIWSSGKGPCGYSTPAPCVFEGRPAVVIVCAQDVFGVDARSGRQLWSRPWKTLYDLNIADPIVAGADVFVSSAYDHGAAFPGSAPRGRRQTSKLPLRSFGKTKICAITSTRAFWLAAVSMGWMGTSILWAMGT